MTNLITLHIVNDIPWSNLNRDDTGTPKRTVLGGVERGLLSSQSLKRAARKDFEERIVKRPTGLDDSYRSRNLPLIVSQRAAKLIRKTGGDPDEKKLLRSASSVIKKLTGKEGGKDTITWMSAEELETLASVLADDTTADQIVALAEKKNASEAFAQFIGERGVTGSLAIAAFGRMFANATSFQTEAAVAVSPAISTHGSFIETDYFIAADDFQNYEEDLGGAGAAHLGVALYTSGIFYRTVTIDIDELWFNWTGRDSESYRELLTQFFKSLIYTLPTGKKNSTAPYSEPLLVIAEQQSYRSAYSISAPITEPDENGYRGETVASIQKQFDLARRISESNYGDYRVSGVMVDDFEEPASSMEDLIKTAISWMDERKPAPVVEEGSIDGEESSDAIDDSQGSGKPTEAPAALRMQNIEDRMV